jgi:putrescine transport system permease protein
MPSVTMSTMMVASALISGLTPRRTLEKMSIGNVVEPGPDTKLVITRSSHDSVKASSHPEMIAGRMIGSVMTKNTFAGRAPRSIAASSSDSSNVVRRDCTTTVT